MPKHERADRLAEHLRPGTFAEMFVYGSLALGVTESIRRRSTKPLVTAGTGLLLGTVATTINSVVNHRNAAHHSSRLKPWVHKTGRVMQSALVGLAVDRSVPEHKIHHAHTDTSLDPHSPVNEGYWGVFLGITGLVNEYDRQHHAAVVHHQDRLSHKMWSDKGIVTVLGIAGTHFLAGRALGLPLINRAITAGMHMGAVYLQDATLTADSHLHGHPQDVGFTPLTGIVMGGEDAHGHHHEHPLDPRHAKYDPGWTVIRGLEMVGLSDPHPTDTAFWRATT